MPNIPGAVSDFCLVVEDCFGENGVKSSLAVAYLLTRAVQALM